jgi:hypothetical protein
MSPICNELRREFQQKLFVYLFGGPCIILTDKSDIFIRVPIGFKVFALLQNSPSTCLYSLVLEQVPKIDINTNTSTTTS